LIGLSYDPYDPGHYIPGLFDQTYVLPWPASGWDGIKFRLEFIKADVGLDLIIPCLDAELPLYIQHQVELEKMGINLFLPEEKTFELRNKEKLGELGEKIGAINPKTIACRNLSELKQATTEVGFPAMVKGPYYKAKKVNSVEEARDAFFKLAEEWGLPVLVQQVVYGEELNLVGLGDGHGQLIGQVSAKKTTITELGKIWSGITIHHAELKKVAEKFVSQTKWRGPFELECMADHQDIFLIEINPRFPAWCWFATAVGVNLPLALVEAANRGIVTPLPNYEAGKFFMRFTDELVCDLDLFRSLVTKGASHVC
jgi:carbamoyl-phosphate synthase large subunit